MQFLHPSFLWALGALAIPIIIHLFHFRRFKKVYFTNVHLLKELKEETSNRNKLKNLLILLARCAALSMLVFAFAQPLIKSGTVDDNQNRAVEIVIDNSFSMQARDTEIPLLTLVKDRAREIINGYQESDLFLILTHDLEAKHQRFVDQKTALDFVSEIQITPNVEELEDLCAVAERIRNKLDDHGHHLYMLSDFQENISSFEEQIDTSVAVTVIPFRAIQESNISIEKAEWLAPIAMKDQPNRLVVTVHNYSNEDQAVELRMTFEGQERPLGSIKIPPREDATDTVNVTINRTGWHELKLSIDDYPVTFDNELYTAFNIKDRIDVTSLNNGRSNSYLRSAFESISYYNLSQLSSNNIRYEIFAEQEMIIIDDLQDISTGLSSELEKFVRAGGNLLIFPSNNANVNSYNNLLGSMGVDRLEELQTERKEVGRMNMDEFVFSNVYETTRRNVRLPITNRNYSLISQQSSGKERLLTYRDGRPFLQKFIVDKGNVYLCSAPLDNNSSDLVTNAEVFVPMLYKMALSTGSRSRLSYVIGEDDVVVLSSISGPAAERYVMKGPVEFIPSVNTSGQLNLMDVRGQIKTSGFYQLMLEDEVIEELGYNYNRKESNVVYGPTEQIANSISTNTQVLSNVALADLSGYISQKTDGIKLWRWCLLLGLLFLLIETALIRFWK